MTSPHCLLDSWWFVSIVHTVFSEPARTWHHQLFEGRSSLVLGIHCQPANTFSEWAQKRSCKEQQYLRSCKSRLYPLVFQTSFLFLCQMNSGRIAHYRCAAFIWQKAFGHTVLPGTQEEHLSLPCAHIAVESLQMLHILQSNSAPASGITVPHHRIARVRGSDLCASSHPSRLRQTPQAWVSLQGFWPLVGYMHIAREGFCPRVSLIWWSKSWLQFLGVWDRHAHDTQLHQ